MSEEGAPVDTSASVDTTPTAPAQDAGAKPVQAAGETGAVQAASQQAMPADAKPVQDAPQAAAPMQVEIEPELLSFADAKGLTAEHLGDEKFRGFAKSYRQAEANMNRLQQENRQLNEQISALSAQSFAQPVDEVGPVQQVKDTYARALQSQCAVLGCQSAAELQQNHPQVWQRLQQAKQEAWEEAVVEESKWQQGKSAREAAQKDKQARFQQEFQSAKMAYSENIVTAKQKNPSIEMDLIKSGVVSMLQEVSKATKMPLEYMMAHKPLFSKAAELAEAWKFVKNKDKWESERRQEWEKGLKESKTAEMPGDTPIPMDQSVLFSLRSQRSGKGVSIQ
jgi:hypothetical protein